MILHIFGTMSQLFRRIVKLIKACPAFLPLRLIGFAAGFSIFVAVMTITPLTATLFTVGTIPALAITPEEILDDPELEARARALSKQLRCLVCQNQSIDDSDADLARDLRIEVRSQINAGLSDEIIIDQIHQKYGDYVLMNPPLDGETLFLWLAPIGFVGLGVMIIVLTRRSLVVPASSNLDAADRARIETMLVNRNHSNQNKNVRPKE